MFTRTVIFVLCFIGFFTIIFSGIATEFYTYQGDYTASTGVPAEVAERFELANVTVYKSYGSANMTYEWSSYWDHPTAPEHQATLPDGQYLEVWWSYESIPYIGKTLEFRHTTEVWWGLAHVKMTVYFSDGEQLGDFVHAYNLEDAWNEAVNASVLVTRTPVATSILIVYNQTKYSTITDAWNGGELGYQISYELDTNSTQMNIWTLIGALLTFQAPNLGISGFGGVLLNALIAIPFWVIVVIAITKLVMAIIPFIKGLEE